MTELWEKALKAEKVARAAENHFVADTLAECADWIRSANGWLAAAWDEGCSAAGEGATLADNPHLGR